MVHKFIFEAARKNTKEGRLPYAFAAFLFILCSDFTFNLVDPSAYQSSFCRFRSGYPALDDIGHDGIAAHAVIPAESADNFSRGKQAGNRFTLRIENLGFRIDLQAAHRMMNTRNDRRRIERGGKQLVLFSQD
mgnify:CR=1 FL=1